MLLADYHATTENIDAATDAALTAALVRAVDPELMVDMLNLGLVYHVVRTDDGNYQVQMLLTQIGCPLTDYLEKMVQHAIALVAPDAQVTVQFRLTPAWSMDRMSRVARMTLGV